MHSKNFAQLDYRVGKCPEVFFLACHVEKTNLQISILLHSSELARLWCNVEAVDLPTEALEHGNVSDSVSPFACNLQFRKNVFGLVLMIGVL
jgi:hypothetical protein